MEILLFDNQPPCSSLFRSMYSEFDNNRFLLCTAGPTWFVFESTTISEHYNANPRSLAAMPSISAKHYRICGWSSGVILVYHVCVTRKKRRMSTSVFAETLLVFMKKAESYDDMTGIMKREFVVSELTILFPDVPVDLIFHSIDLIISVSKSAMGMFKQHKRRHFQMCPFLKINK